MPPSGSAFKPDAEMSRQPGGAVVDRSGDAGRGELSVLDEFACEERECFMRQMGREVQHQPAFDKVFQSRRPFVFDGILYGI